MKSLAAIIVFVSLLVPSLAAQEPTPEALIKAGHFKRARSIVEPRYKKANSADAELNYLMSEIKDAFGDLEDARSMAERAVALNGQVARYHRLLGDLYGETAETASLFAKGGWAKKFKSEVDTAASLDPKDVDSRFDLLEYYLQAPRLMGGGKDKAAGMADEISRIDPVQGDLAQARLAQDHKDVAAQESWYRKAAATGPNDYDVLVTVAGFYNSAAPAKPDLAEKYARQAVEADSTRAAGYAALASSLASHARWKELDDSLKLAEKNVPDDLVAYYQAGRAILTRIPADPGSAGNLDLNRAETYFRKYLALEPEGGEPTLAHAHWRLGLVLEREGRKPEARSELETALRLKPDLAGAKQDLKRLQP